MLTRKEAIRRYGSDYQINKHINSGELYKIAKGLYSEENNISELSIISMKYPNGIITMESAFYFHGLTDIIPDTYALATERNSSKISDKRVHQYFVPDSFFTVGAERMDWNGCIVNIYGKERMLIELLRFQTKLPFDYYKEIILNFRKQLPAMNIQKIQDYALSCPNSNKVCERLQLEVL